jgi:hypothetical protein
MKKKIFFACVIFLALSTGLSGCILNKEIVEGYEYQNKELGFSFIVPKEFEYYHFQQKRADGLIDLEAFTPTADTSYAQEVSGYAKFVTIRVTDGKKDPGEGFKKIGAGKNKAYSIRFWQTLPTDWTDRWSPELQERMEKSFKII